MVLASAVTGHLMFSFASRLRVGNTLYPHGREGTFDGMHMSIKENDCMK
jgi:hypothetical protein